MKKIVAFSLSLFFSISIFAQGHLFSPTWKVKSFGISLGYEQDMLSGMDHTYFLSTIRGNTNFNYSNLNLEREYIGSMICENPHLRLNLTLLPPGMRNMELHLALVGIAGRIDYVEYVSPDKGWNDPDFQSMNFDLSSDEIDLEASFLKRFPARSFNFFAGLGTNLGITTRGNLRINGHNIRMEDNNVIGLRNSEDPSDQSPDNAYLYERYDAKTAFSQRLFAQVGFSFAILSRFELGMEYRRGVGYRAVGGAPVNTTHLQSVGLTTRWIFR